MRRSEVTGVIVLLVLSFAVRRRRGEARGAEEEQLGDLETPAIGPPPRLGHEALAEAQRETLDTPRRTYGLAALALFRLLDVIYGRPRSLSKFKVLELVARVPYQSWEQVAYIAITHVARRTGLARRVH